MSEEELQNLIREWYRSDASQEAERLLTPTPGCPSLPLLWRHHAQDKPLGEYEQHVAGCERCRHLGDIITAKLHGLGSASRTKYINWVAGLVACAACVGLVFLLSDDRDRDDTFTMQMGVFCELVFADAPDAVRGEAAADEAPAELPQWIVQALADDELREAFDDLDQLDGQLNLPLSEGDMLFREHRPVLAEQVDPQTRQGKSLVDLLRRYDSACDKIVALLIRYLPDASENDRVELRSTLDRWRADNVFGLSE